MTSLAPSPEQQSILDLGLEPIRIRAGAGTGKTTTVAMVIANLVANHGVDPERILGITFTNKAAAELADRVRQDLGEITAEGRQAEIHTYHGFAAQILAEFGSLVGVDSRVRVITPTFSRQVLSEILHRSRYQRLNITDVHTVNKARTLADRLADHLQTPEAVLDTYQATDDVMEERAELLQTLLRYDLAKRDHGVVDYGDLVTLSTRAMQGHPGLAERVRQRYQAVVLDEYQDTNPAQRVMLTSIFGKGFPVIAVGDEDQTIYEWRGATPENFELFPHHFGTPSHPVHERGLTTNRRSAQHILDVANAIRRQANPEADGLVAHDQSLSGSVVTYWASDAIAEAEWIVERFHELHDKGTSWKEMAVLIRKNKDFAPVVDAMRNADIPIEVANLGGLLSVPEVAELRAWLTILDRPHDSAAVTQVLFGSRYHLGLADIAPLAEALHGERQDDRLGVSLLEAMENLDSMVKLRPGAKAALAHFFETYRTILTESQGSSLIETCRLVLDATNAWQDAEALPKQRRLTARLNLYRMLDQAEDWSPLSGRPSLSAFLDYLDAMEEEPAEELDAARLSGEDAVTLVTIHRAKGLEWDVVAIPCVTQGNFPSGTSGGYPDPVRFGQHLPAQFRIDSVLDGMPDDDDARKDFFREALRRQEWRVAYVALTRAKTHLFVTGAHWYGRPEPNRTPKKPSELFDLIASQAGVTEAGRAAVGPRPDILRKVGAPPPPDPLFPNGWASALRQDSEADSPSAIAYRMGISDEFEQKMSQHRNTLFAIEEFTETEPIEQSITVSVTGLVTYARCPKRYFWSEVEPLPRRRNRAAEAGTALHRRIELFQRGSVPFEEVERDLYDVPDDASGVGGWTVFEKSRFATERATAVEVPFTVESGSGYKIKGRIDAIYVSDGECEIVDFKSGRPKTDDASLVQLQAYAAASQVAELGLPAVSSTKVTFAYLGGGLHEDTFEADDMWIEKARQRLDYLTRGIDDAEFSENPGEHCANCDFLRFCTPGSQWLEGR